MEAKLRKLTARSLAGLIYEGKVSQTLIYQGLEELGLDEKLVLVDELLEDMNSIADHYAALNRG